eukprot:363668-Chlamydomonas_euryale.AAC.3
MDGRPDLKRTNGWTAGSEGTGTVPWCSGHAHTPHKRTRHTSAHATQAHTPHKRTHHTSAHATQAHTPHKRTRHTSAHATQAHTPHIRLHENRHMHARLPAGPPAPLWTHSSCLRAALHTRSHPSQPLAPCRDRKRLRSNVAALAPPARGRLRGDDSTGSRLWAWRGESSPPWKSASWRAADALFGECTGCGCCASDAASDTDVLAVSQKPLTPPLPPHTQVW